MKKFLEGFVSFEVAIYFRLDYNDNIDRCAFFEKPQLCKEEYANIKTQNKINNYQKPEIK